MMMKRFLMLPLIIVCGLTQAQRGDSMRLPKTVSIPALSVPVTVNKTTNLIFPCTIKNVDRGVEELLVQKVEGAGHILQLKALSAQLPETNLSVVTDDLQLYSFLIRYDTNQPVLTYKLLDNGNIGSATAPPGEKGRLNDGQIQQDLQKVSVQKPYLHRIKNEKEGMLLKVEGLYIHEDVLYLSLRLKNNSPLNYDVESLQVFIRDRKKNARTTNQDVLLERRAVWGDTVLVKAGADQQLVLAIPKFTIPDQKNCLIQLRESNGGRHLECRLRNKNLIHSQTMD